MSNKDKTVNRAARIVWEISAFISGVLELETGFFDNRRNIRQMEQSHDLTGRILILRKIVLEEKPNYSIEFDEFVTGNAVSNATQSARSVQFSNGQTAARVASTDFGLVRRCCICSKLYENLNHRFCRADGYPLSEPYFLEEIPTKELTIKKLQSGNAEKIVFRA